MKIKKQLTRVTEFEGNIKYIEFYDQGTINFWDLTERWPKYDAINLAYLALNFLKLHIIDRTFKDDHGIYYSGYILDRLNDQSSALDFCLGLHFVKVEFNKKDLVSFFDDLHSASNWDPHPDDSRIDLEEEDLSSWDRVRFDLDAVEQLETKFPELFEHPQIDQYEDTESNELERLTRLNNELKARIKQLEAKQKQGFKEATVNDYRERMPEIVAGVFALEDKWKKLPEGDPRLKYGFTEDQVKAITGIRNKYVVKAFKTAMNMTKRVKVKRTKGVSKSD